MRALLEAYAVRMAMEANAFTEEDFQEMRNLIKQLGDLGGSDFEAKTIDVDMRFHHIICYRCEHSLLMEELEHLRSLTLLFILNTKLYRSDVVQDEVSHTAILDAILTGNPEYAAQVVADHIDDAGTSLLKRMELESDIQNQQKE
jgi:DNA-binding GntR family transcriptional regulator